MKATHALARTIVSQWTVWAYQNNMSRAVIGMSGGCDSYVAAKFATIVFGKENVVGVLMPNGTQADIADAERACKDLGIASTVHNIKESYDAIVKEFPHASDKARINLAPRLRMSTLYFIAQSIEGAHVVTTSNASELFVGYCTLWGDSVGDYAPLKECPKTLVRALGLTLGLIPELVNKAPADGLTGKTDEDILGVTYDNIDKYILGSSSGDTRKLSKLIERARFKQELLAPIPPHDVFPLALLRQAYDDTLNSVGSTPRA